MLIGECRVEIIPDTEFRLDGGAMFGVVPRVVWERVCSPDENNRIRLNMNCVFIDTDKEKVLIETGIGEKWSAKDIARYGIERKRAFADSLFDLAGCRPEEIDIVINTHLHFDHAGGNTISSGQSSVVSGRSEPPGSAGGQFAEMAATPQFQNARYLVSKRELEHAESPHERDRVSYLRENWRPMIETGQLELVPDEYEPIPGLRLQTVRGHSETMQTWRLDRGGKTMYGFADLIPTRHHLNPAWVMGYDLYPTETLTFKKDILPKAVEDNWLCLFYHDFDGPVCRIISENGKFSVVPYDEGDCI